MFEKNVRWFNKIFYKILLKNKYDKSEFNDFIKEVKLD